MKKFWKYFLILILLLAGLFCIGLLYLFFVPGSTLFNIKYIGYSKDYESLAYHMSAIETISMTNRSYDVKIVNSESENISVVVHSKTFGYVLEKNSIVAVNTNVNERTLNINITEPHGLTLNSFSYIELRIPENYSPNLKLSNKRAKTTIEDENITLNSLTYSTNSGDFNFEHGNVSNYLDLNLNRASFNIDKEVTASNPNVELSLTSGKFKAASNSFNEVVVNKNKRGVIEIGDCSNFIEKVKSAGGKVVIKTATHVDIESSDTNIVVTDLNGGTIKLTESGKVKITNLNGFASIETNSGSISITNANAAVMLVSNTGYQKISSATRRVQADSIYGDITINFAEEAGDYSSSDTNPFRSLIATTEDGKITVTGVENIRAQINDNGRAYITMRHVLGENIVQGKRGEVQIITPNDDIYNLITESTDGGSVYVNVGEIEVNGYTTQERTENYINLPDDFVGPLNNQLEVTTTSGSLTVVDEMNG